jgi:SAM-dependent methyltransferase
VDYLLSSHCLEHCPNTIKVLREWIRVLRSNGYLFLVLPHGERTFDRGRELTTLSHHIEDFDRNVSFEDMTHWPEFEKFSIPQYNHAWIAEGTRPDGTIDPLWCVNHGAVHYHVWTQHEMSELLRYLGLSIAAIVECLPERLDSFAIVGRVNQ